MSRLAIVLRGRGSRWQPVIDSCRAHNPDDIPLVFLDAESAEDESALLALGERDDFDAYVALSPAMTFLRDVRVQDFVADSGDPYAFVTEAAETAVQRDSRGEWLDRTRDVEAILRELNVKESRRLRSADLFVYSKDTLASFRENFLAPRGWSYGDAVRVAPRAADWHWAWQATTNPRQFVVREPLSRTFSGESDVRKGEIEGLTLDDLARGYAVAIDGGIGLPPWPGSAAHSAASMSLPILAKAQWLGVYRRAPRIQRLVERVRR